MRNGDDGDTLQTCQLCHLDVVKMFAHIAKPRACWPIHIRRDELTNNLLSLGIFGSQENMFTGAT